MYLYRKLSNSIIPMHKKKQAHSLFFNSNRMPRDDSINNANESYTRYRKYKNVDIKDSQNIKCFTD